MAQDYYMQMCMIHLGVQGVADFGLVGDHRPAPQSPSGKVVVLRDMRGW